jgi:hypothetical protein
MAGNTYLLREPPKTDPVMIDNIRKLNYFIQEVIKNNNKLNLNYSSTDKVKVSANDLLSGTLDTKLAAGTNITLTQLNDGNNESLRITAGGGAHTALSDMPDTGGTNTNHDTRYVAQQGTSAPTVPAPYEGMFWYDTDEPEPEIFLIGDGAAGVDFQIKVDGETNDGVITWMEDEDYFKFDDDILLPDNEKIKFGTGVDMDIYYDGTNGCLNTNLVAASDFNINCGTDKTIVLTETVWDDMRIVPGSFDRPGVGGATPDPTIVAYNVNGGGVTTYLYQFQLTAMASFTVQLPHGYKQGTDIAAHVHWTAGPRGNEESGKMVGWKLDYSWANIDGTFGTMATLDLQDACAAADHTHQMSPEATIDGHTAAKNISSMLLCNIKRTDTGTDDTWVGTVSGELPMLLEIDFHYQVDTIGSRQQLTK